MQLKMELNRGYFKSLIVSVANELELYANLYIDILKIYIYRLLFDMRIHICNCAYLE